MVYAVALSIHRTPFKEMMGPVMVRVFEDEEVNQLGGRGTPSWEGHLDVEADERAEGMEEDNEGHLHEEVDEEDELGTPPLLGGRWLLRLLDLVAQEEAWKGVSDDPGEASARVDDFMGPKGQEARCNDTTMPVSVVCSPKPLHNQ